MYKQYFSRFDTLANCVYLFSTFVLFYYHLKVRPFNYNTVLCCHPSFRVLYYRNSSMNSFRDDDFCLYICMNICALRCFPCFCIINVLILVISYPIFPVILYMEQFYLGTHIKRHYSARLSLTMKLKSPLISNRHHVN